MATYLYELPTTGAITFSDFCFDQTSLYTVAISDATQARANLRATLKASKRTDGEKDFLKVIKVVDDYLPYIYGFKAAFDAGEIALLSEPVFSWRSTLSANIFNSSPRQDVYSLHADLAFTVLTYAFALSNLARSTVASLGNYEHERTISEVERKAKDDKLNFAVTLLCRASGAFKYLAEKVLPEWDKDDAGAHSRPPDVTLEVTNALAKMALGDAQQLAIRKLLSKSAYESTLTPGPPLPKSHPKPVFAAKLYLECATLYSSARALAKTPGATRRTKAREPEDVNPELRHYLADEAQLCGALARKWLGVDAGENGDREGGGKAVAFLGWAVSELKELKDGRLGVSLDKERREKREQFKKRVAVEIQEATVFWNYYKNMNNSVHFQPVPPVSALQSSIPAGLGAFGTSDPKPFVPPAPAFGPGSVEYVRRQAELLEVNVEVDGQDEQEMPERPNAVHSSSSYAGAGSYF